MPHKAKYACMHAFCNLPSRGVPNTSKQGTKSELAHKWAYWRHHPCCLGGPHRFKAGGKIRTGPQMGVFATSPLPSRGAREASKHGTTSEVAHKWADGGAQRLKEGDKIRSGPQEADWLHRRRRPNWSPTLQSRGQNQNWPINGRIGYITPAVWGGGGGGTLQRGGQNQNLPTNGRIG